MVAMIAFSSTTVFAQCSCGCGCHSKPSPSPCEMTRPAPHPGCGCHKEQITPEEFVKIMTEKQAYLESQLCLTKEQKAKAQVLLQNKIKDLVPIITEIKAKKAELKALEACRLQFTKKSKEAALKKAIYELKESKRAVMVKYHQDFEAMLTDTQKQKLKDVFVNRPMPPAPSQDSSQCGCGCGCHKKGGCKLPLSQPVEEN